MKLATYLPLLCASILSVDHTNAQLPFGSVAADISLTASKLLADPVRPRVYATVPATNLVAVIDTNTLEVIGAYPVGSTPVDMAISPDGNTLYVANFGSFVNGISVLDLNALAAGTPLTVAGQFVTVAAGLDGRVYAANHNGECYQIDTAHGDAQTEFASNLFYSGQMQISPDRKTLFVASVDIEPGSLTSFDVTTSTPSPLRTNSQASYNAMQMVISHNGKYICLPSGGGNPGASVSASTFLFSTGDITSHFGAFLNGVYPGPLAFSPDDSTVYQTVNRGNLLQAFDTQSFVKLNEVNLPAYGANGYSGELTSVALDHTGTYLFASEKVSNGVAPAGRIIVIATGVGNLAPPLPTVTLNGESDALVMTGADEPVFTFTRTGDLSKKLIVQYSIAGSGINGFDYQTISGAVKFKRNKASATVVIVPTNQPTRDPLKKVNLKLLAAPAYQVGVPSKAKVHFQSNQVQG